MQFIKLDNKKRPLTKMDIRYYKHNYNDWDNVGVILGTEIIVLDFDGDNANEEIIINYIDKTFPTLSVKTTRGKHFYYRAPKHYKFNKGIKKVSVLGFMCDYLTGEKQIATIKLNGKVREMNKEFSFDDLPELPECLYPLYKVKENKLSGMVEGDARNNKLFSHLLSVRESYPEIDIQSIANIINNNIFNQKLSNNELKQLIRSVNNKEIVENKNYNKLNEIKYSSVKELQEKNLPPITFYVENLLPQGLNLICSLPKIGKSFMAFDLCLSVSRGKTFLGFNTKQAGCLYLALEDSENRLQDRLNKILNGEKAPGNFKYSTKCDDIENGLINQLQAFIKKEPHIKVIVIDTLQKVRGSYKGSNNYANDYKEIGKLKEFADSNGLCIILIHHLKKGNESDVFNKVSGTNGITGTADTTIVLDKKERNDINTTMSIVGRDVETNDFIIQFDKNIYKWKMISSVEENKERTQLEEYQNNPLVDTIKKLVNENNGKYITSLKEIVQEFKKLHPYLTEPKPSKKELNKIIPLLKKYDNINYFEYGYPINGKRPKVFTKMSVENVENVEIVE